MKEVVVGLVLVIGGVLTALLIPDAVYVLALIGMSFFGAGLMLHGSDRLCNEEKQKEAKKR